MKSLLFSALVVLVWVSSACAETLHLHVPIISDSPNQHFYYDELLVKAIEASGHSVEITSVESPQQRTNLLLDAGLISLSWLITSDERNKRYLRIPFGLTNGLIGTRILFIRKGDQTMYDEVNTLSDFRSLNVVGGMGKGWFDVNVWKMNKLKYHEHSGNWESIFKMIPKGRQYDYFARGLNEILTEAKQYPDLKIEENLALIYDRDFSFYLSKAGPNAGAKYYDIIRTAIKQASENGLITELVQKYWGNDLELLNYDKRIKLYLDTPK